MKGTERHAMLIDAATRVCRRDGWSSLSMRRVAAEAGCSIKLVNYYFSASDLRNEIIARAIDTRDTRLIAGAYGDNHPIAKKAVANDATLLAV